MNNSKAAVTVSGIISKIQIVCGVICIFFGIMGISIIEEQQDKGVAITLTIIFLGGGFLLVRNSRRRKKLIQEFKKYVIYISENPFGSISDLAMSMGKSEDEIRKNLDIMIKKKYFTNAYVDLKENRVVISNAKPVNNVPENYTAPTINPDDIEYVSITCPSCGGVNKVEKGTVYECDFCGSHING